MKKLLFFIYLLPAIAQAQIITTVAGNGVGMGGTTGSYTGDGGPAVAAGLSYPTGVAADGAGNIYIADNLNHCVRKVDAAGIITTIAGNGTIGCSGDGGPATAALLYAPYDVILDRDGNIFIADFGCSRIRKIDVTGTITTVAGNGTVGPTGDGGPATAAGIDAKDVAIDTAGNIYIADHNTIRKVNALGIISTIAGTGVLGFSGDGGPATAAQFRSPWSIAVDKAENIYIVDNGNSVIRKIGSDGIIHTIAGIPGFGGSSGDGGPATDALLNFPTGVKADSAGNLYISVTSRVRKVNTSGIINTIAGTGSSGYSGDGGDPLLAQLFGARNVGLTTNGNMYIADASNQRVRLVRYNVGVNDFNNNTIATEVFPNPTNNGLTVSCTEKIMKIIISNAVGQVVHSQGCNSEDVRVNVAQLPKGIYIMQVTAASGLRAARKFVKE